MKLDKKIAFGIVLASNGKTAHDAREAAIAAGWKPGKNSTGKTPDELFAAWYDAKRKAMVANIVEDKAIREGVVDNAKQFKQLVRLAGSSSPFYFVRDNFDAAMRIVVDEAQSQLDDATTLLENAGDNAAEELHTAVEDAKSRLEDAEARLSKTNADDWFDAADKLIGELADSGTKNIGNLLDELNIRI